MKNEEWKYGAIELCPHNYVFTDSCNECSQEKELIKRLSKPALCIVKLEQCMLKKLNALYGTNCKTMIEFRDTVLKWCPADGMEDDCYIEE